MDSRNSEQVDSSSSSTVNDTVTWNSLYKQNIPVREIQSILSTSGISSWAWNIKGSRQPHEEDSQPIYGGQSTLQRLANGFGSLLVSNSAVKDESAVHNTTAQPGVLGSLKKNFVDSSRTALKTVQDKANEIVAQNKRLYQVTGSDLDLTYITENIIALGFPVGGISSGIFRYFEGYYRSYMEEVIKLFEAHHEGKYKVYNLCSEKLYDVSMFEGKVTCFPIDDHNCPPLQLIMSFCGSARSWLKQDMDNIVVVHCKDGVSRTGLMVSSLLLYLRIFPTADESIDYFNKKRCIDSKGLASSSQIRYVKYFQRILTCNNGEIQPARRCMLRGFRLHNCPYWIRPSITISRHDGILFSTKRHVKTKDLMPEDFWFKSKQKGMMIFALPGEPGLTEVAGDFKIHFHDSQGDFYCWLNTAMMENKIILSTPELDGFEMRKIPSPGFQVEIVLVDYDGSHPQKDTGKNAYDGSSGNGNSQKDCSIPNSSKEDKDDVFSDSDAEVNGSPKRNNVKVDSGTEPSSYDSLMSKVPSEKTASINNGIKEVSSENEPVDALVSDQVKKKISIPATEVTAFINSTTESEFKAIAADASVFSFGDEDEDDYQSE